ncbi:MAG: alpha/beta fold hydrolase [Caldilinea sp.]
MQPFPELMPFVRRVVLAQSGFSLFLYDTESGASADGPILLVHGLGDEADTWRHVLPSLVAQRRVLAVDLPGFGRSDKPDAPCSVPWYAGVLLDLLDTLRIERVILVGHSLGAIVSHWLALEHPARVERLVLLGGGLVAGKQKLDIATLLLLAPGLGEWLYARLRTDPQAAYDSLRPFYADLDALPQSDRDFLYARVNERVQSNDQRRAFLRTLRGLVRWLPGQQKMLATRLPAIETPTTILWGELDRVATVENGRALAAIQPSARMTVIPGAGHNLQQERPEAIIAALSTP